MVSGSIVRRTLAAVAAILAVWLGLGAASAASAEVPTTGVVVQAYDDTHDTGWSRDPTTEHGPPATCELHSAHAVDDRSHGVSARPDTDTPPLRTIFDDSAALVQVAAVVATTDEQVGRSGGAPTSLAPSDVAANAGVRTCLNSFTAETLVLMADGTRKPIKDVKLGDKVMATDPETGETGPRKVVDLIRHGGLHTMVAVRLSDGSTIDATDRHPFWVESRGEWVDAIDLQPGDVVVTADGDRLTVESLGISEQDLTAYNLTVEGLHTYFVGAEDVLVHNAACPTGLRGASDGLTSVFGGGSVRSRFIAYIRSGLLDNGFTQGLSNNKSGYRFINGTGEEVRIMSRGGQRDIRVRNADGNWLDEFGHVARDRAGSHDIFVYSR